MFDLYCPVAGDVVLRGPRSVRSMHNTSAGIVTYVECQCGQLAVVVTGRFATGTRVHHPTAEAPVSAGVA